MDAPMLAALAVLALTALSFTANAVPCGTERARAGFDRLRSGRERPVPPGLPSASRRLRWTLYAISAWSARRQPQLTVETAGATI
jgi:hypothetical protein